MEVRIQIFDETEQSIVSDAMRAILVHRAAIRIKPVNYATPVIEPTPIDKTRKPRRKQTAEEKADILAAKGLAADTSERVSWEDLKETLEKPEPEPVTEPVTKERLQELFRAYAPSHVERAKSLLNQFGVSRLGELPEEKYAAFATAMQA